MIILTEINNGHVASCKSEDGLVTALACPTTTQYGEFELVDADGRHMWRGLYPDADGYYRDNRVPAPIWESAKALMRDWTAHQRAREDAAEQRALERDLARYDSQSEKIAQDMDRKDSDL